MINTLKETMHHAKRVYNGIKTQEQLIVADTYCELLLSMVKPEDLDELIDCISICQEKAKLKIRMSELNEKFVNENGCSITDMLIKHLSGNNPTTGTV